MENTYDFLEESLTMSLTIECGKDLPRFTDIFPYLKLSLQHIIGAILNTSRDKGLYKPFNGT